MEIKLKSGLRTVHVHANACTLVWNVRMQMRETAYMSARVYVCTL
jgi:hypothetical protein